MQVAVVVAGVDYFRQAAGDIEGVVGGGAVYGLAGAVAEAVVDELELVTKSRNIGELPGKSYWGLLYSCNLQDVSSVEGAVWGGFQAAQV